MAVCAPAHKAEILRRIQQLGQAADWADTRTPNQALDRPNLVMTICRERCSGDNDSEMFVPS
jgi:hypothetical protein